MPEQHTVWCAISPTLRLRRSTIGDLENRAVLVAGHFEELVARADVKIQAAGNKIVSAVTDSSRSPSADLQPEAPGSLLYRVDSWREGVECNERGRSDPWPDKRSGQSTAKTAGR